MTSVWTFRVMSNMPAGNNIPAKINSIIMFILAIVLTLGVIDGVTNWSPALINYH